MSIYAPPAIPNLMVGVGTTIGRLLKKSSTLNAMFTKVLYLNCPVSCATSKHLKNLTNANRTNNRLLLTIPLFAL